MLTEVKNKTHHYFADTQGRKQGEFKEWLDNGNICRHCFFVNNKFHGEYKSYWPTGKTLSHCFYIDDERVYFDVIPYPETDEDRMYFKLKYNLQLLPV